MCCSSSLFSPHRISCLHAFTLHAYYCTHMAIVVLSFKYMSKSQNTLFCGIHSNSSTISSYKCKELISPLLTRFFAELTAQCQCCNVLIKIWWMFKSTKTNIIDGDAMISLDTNRGMKPEFSNCFWSSTRIANLFILNNNNIYMNANGIKYKWYYYL